MQVNSLKLRDIIINSRIFEIFSFIVANILIGSIFFLFFDNHEIQIYLLYLFAFILSILFLKNNWILSIFSTSNIEKKDKKSKSSNLSSPKKSLDISLIKMGLVTTKQFFFNVSYELFPVLVVWIGVLGFSYVICNTISTIFIGENVLFFYPKSDFYQIITVLGIILGVYQFYLSRHEQKILTKINFSSRKIQEIIQRETTFDKYQDFISGRLDPGFVNWVNESTNPKLNFFNLLRAIRQDPEIFGSFKELFFPLSRERSVAYRNRPLVNFQIIYRDSNQKFTTIEYLSKIESREGKLAESYKQFFIDEKKIKELIDDIKSEIDIKEFGILVLSNINILHEIIPDFISYDMRNLVVDLFQQDLEKEDMIKNCKTAPDYRTVLEKSIIRIFYKEIFGSRSQQLKKDR